MALIVHNPVVTEAGRRSSPLYLPFLKVAPLKSLIVNPFGSTIATVALLITAGFVSGSMANNRKRIKSAGL